MSNPRKTPPPIPAKLSDYIEVRAKVQLQAEKELLTIYGNWAKNKWVAERVPELIEHLEDFEGTMGEALEHATKIAEVEWELQNTE